MEQEEGSSSSSSQENSSTPSWEDFCQQLRIKNIKFPKPKTLEWILRNSSEVKLTQLKADVTLEFMEAKLDESLKIMNAIDSYDVQLRSSKTLIRLNNLKREKEVLVQKSVQAKEDYERLLAKQAQEYCIQRQVDYQKMIESTVPDQDQEKEQLVQEVKSSQETLASLEQELTAKSRSVRRVKEDKNHLEIEVNSLKYKLNDLENEVQGEHEKSTKSSLLLSGGKEKQQNSNSLKTTFEMKDEESSVSCNKNENDDSFIETMDIDDDDDDDEDDFDFVDVIEDE